MDDYSAGAHGRKHLKVGLLRLNSVLLKLLQQSSADHLAKSPTPQAWLRPRRSGKAAQF